jgi:cell division protein FtsW
MRDFAPASAGRRYEPVQMERLSRARGESRSGARELPVRPPVVRPPALGAKGGSKRDLHDPDWVIVVAVVALAAVGILMVYSASAIPSYAASQNSFQMVAPQIGAGLAGLVAMIVLARIDYRYLRKASIVLAIVAIALLVAVLIPWIGASHNGAARWIKLGPFFDIHPSEVAKLALVVYLAHWLATRGTQIKSFVHGTVPYWIIVLPFVVLVAREPDLGTTSIIVVIALTLFFVAGANLVHLGMALAAGAAGGALLVFAVGDYALRRIEVFLDPWSDRDAGYHIIKSLEALGAGGLFGTGLGNDRVLVPQDYNDFVFSIIGQELGFVGGLVVIGLFVALAWAGIRTALRAPDTFGGLLAAGITAWICCQAIINICVVLALVPVTGITLPFVSQGGSSLVVSFAAVGILLSISRETVERGWVNASADRGRGYGRTYLPGSRSSSIAAGSTGRS